MKSYVDALKALADDTRLRILRLLLTNHTAMCVCELVDALEERQYNISSHLQILEAAQPCSETSSVFIIRPTA
jgi:ArsR family transcriptional regulator